MCAYVMGVTVHDGGKQYTTNLTAQQPMRLENASAVDGETQRILWQLQDFRAATPANMCAVKTVHSEPIAPSQQMCGYKQSVTTMHADLNDKRAAIDECLF